MEDLNQVMEDLKMTRSASDRELGEVHLFCHVHMSLPCTGGSPLQNFSGAKRVPEHERKFFELLAACEKLLDRLVERHPELSMSLNCQFQQVLDSSEAASLCSGQNSIQVCCPCLCNGN